MNLKKFLEKNSQRLYLNYSFDKKFAILFNDDEIFLFQSKNISFNKSDYYLINKITEKNKFKKWQEINKKILSENSPVELLYTTSELLKN